MFAATVFNCIDNTNHITVVIYNIIKIITNIYIVLYENYILLTKG
jgi:hypothetical protein